MNWFRDNVLLFGDPVQWAKSAVGSWIRFWFSALFFAFIVITSMTRIQQTGLEISAIVLIVGLQLMVLYSLRRLYLLLKDHAGQQVQASD